LTPQAFSVFMAARRNWTNKERPNPEKANYVSD
jgi:hypothetical protein